jgi:hypothetical protein
MPIHVWTKVGAGTWRDSHFSWISEFRSGLNSGRLPSDYYANAEQIIGSFVPDVWTLQKLLTRTVRREPKTEAWPLRPSHPK